MPGKAGHSSEACAVGGQKCLSAHEDEPPRSAAAVDHGSQKKEKSFIVRPSPHLESPHNLSFAQIMKFRPLCSGSRFTRQVLRCGQTKGGHKGCADSALLYFCKTSFLSFAKPQCGIFFLAAVGN
jgi:hypothetical protein